MDLTQFEAGLKERDWENLQHGSHFGVDFDLIGERRCLAATKWNVLVKVLPVLDERTLATWTANFEDLCKRSNNLIRGRCFLLCLLAEKIPSELTGRLQGDESALLDILRLEGGGGSLLVADLAGLRVYGEVPPLPVDAHKFSKGVKDLLSDVVGAPPMPAAGPPPLPGSTPPPLP